MTVSLDDISFERIYVISLFPMLLLVCGCDFVFFFFIQNPTQLSLLSPVGSWPNTSQAVAVATAAAGLFQNGFAHGHVPPVYSGLLNGRGN